MKTRYRDKIITVPHSVSQYRFSVSLQIYSTTCCYRRQSCEAFNSACINSVLKILKKLKRHLPPPFVFKTTTTQMHDKSTRVSFQNNVDYFR